MIRQRSSRVSVEKPSQRSENIPPTRTSSVVLSFLIHLNLWLFSFLSSPGCCVLFGAVLSPYHECVRRVVFFLLSTFTKFRSYFNIFYDVFFCSLMLHWSQDYGRVFVLVRLLNFDFCWRRKKKWENQEARCRVFCVALNMFNEDGDGGEVMSLLMMLCGSIKLLKIQCIYKTSSMSLIPSLTTQPRSVFLSTTICVLKSV